MFIKSNFSAKNQIYSHIDEEINEGGLALGLDFIFGLCSIKMVLS